MGDFINAVMIGLISFLVLLSGFWYVVEVGADHQILVEQLENRWGQVGPDFTELQTRLVFHNPHRVQIELVRVEYEILVNEKRVHWQRDLTSVAMPPQSRAPVDLSAQLPAAFAHAWMASHVGEGEQTVMAVSGMAQFLVSQNPVLVPFAGDSTTWSTRLAPSLATLLPSCAPESSTPCIASATTGWERSRSAVSLTALIDFENPTARFQTMSNLTVGLRLSDTPIAVAHRLDSVALGPRQTERVAVTFDLIEEGLATWWPQHVAARERSPLAVDVGYEVFEENFQPLPANESQNETPYQPQVVKQNVAWTRDGATFETAFIASQFDNEKATPE